MHRVTIHRLENAGGGRVPGRQHRTASMDKPPKDRMRPSGDELAAGPGRSTRSPGGIRKLHERVAVARVRPLSMSVSAKRPRTSPRMPPPGRDGDLPRRDSASGTNSANEGGGVGPGSPAGTFPVPGSSSLLPRLSHSQKPGRSPRGMLHRIRVGQGASWTSNGFVGRVPVVARKYSGNRGAPTSIDVNNPPTGRRGSQPGARDQRSLQGNEPRGTQAFLRRGTLVARSVCRINHERH